MAAPAIAAQEFPIAHRAGLAVLGGSCLLGLVAACFIPMGPLGFGFPITVLAAFGVYGLVNRVSLVRPQTKATYLWIPVLLFSALIAWRDAPALKFLNVLMVAVFGGIIAIRARPSMISKGSAWDYPFRALGAWFVAFVDTFNLLFNDIAWRLIPQGGHGKNLTSIFRGLLLATPLLIIFGALFVNADARFEKLLSQMFNFNAEAIVEQSFVGFAIAWFAAGLLRRVYIGANSQSQITAPPIQQLDGSGQAIPSPNQTISSSAHQQSSSSRLGLPEIAIVLGSLNALFLLFVATQWPYFFGGIQNLRATSGLSVAEYARRGFFELVAVSALALPTLLGLHSLVDPESNRMRNVFKFFSLALVALLAIVMLSAAFKMKLYMETFSLSTLRIYVAAALLFLGLVFAWFSLTTLRERANRFAWGGILVFAAMVFGLNVLNPDSFVARWNIQNTNGKPIDWNYLSTLSADATSTIARNWEKVPKDSRPEIADALIGNNSPKDWRSQNLSQFEAERSLSANQAEIEKVAKEYVEPNYEYGY